MEPRPSRPTRATGQSSTRTTRTPWTPSPPAEPSTSQRTADIYGAPPSQSGGQWYGQQAPYAPEPGDYRQTGPMTPIKPRGERGNKLLRYLLAALLLIAVIGGGAYAITRYLDNDDKPETPVVAATNGTVTPTLAATQAPAEQTAPTATVPPPPTTAPPPTEAADDGNAAAQEVATATTADASSGEESESDTVSGTQAFLPDPSALDGDWTVTDEGERTKAEVADAIGPDGDNQLTSWRWRDNFYLDLTRTDPASFPDETTYINVSVHRFANPEGASEALTALSDIVINVQGLQVVETPAIGDQARGLAGPGEGVNLYVLYVQDGKYLIRLGGSSATGDPAETVNGLAETIVESQDGSA